MSVTRLPRAKTSTGRVVRQAVRGIRPRTPVGKIAVALGAEIGGVVGDAAQRAFVNVGWSPGAGDSQTGEGTDERLGRAQRLRWHTAEALREQQEAGRRAEEDARRRTAGQGLRTYCYGGKIVANYYEVLEVSPKARQSVIEKAYRALMREDHPDQGGDARKAQLINEAYHVLRDPAERRKYDEQNGFG